jgi:hypothetical protein
MRATAALGLFCAVVAAGCRATPQAPPDDMQLDLAVPSASGDGLADADLAVADLACPVGPEICGNGCDDDRNGYTDDDDPACTTQMLVTLSVAQTPALWRLILEPTPHVVALDGNPVAKGGMAAYNQAFAPAAFIAFDASKLLVRQPLGGSATAATPSWSTRDTCVFNGELIVVEPMNLASGGGKLHRFMADGKTELMPSVPVANTASACASDGNLLYVATHAGIMPSAIAVFTKGANGPVDTGTRIPIPDALLNNQYDRIVDLAYVKKGGVFIGLFANSTSAPGAADNALDGQVMARFGFDGGVGPYIDGGVWHGVGEFLP